MPGIATIQDFIRLPLRVLLCFAIILHSIESIAGEKQEILPPTELVCHLFFPEAAVSDVNTIYIPFTLVGQLIMVQAKVDTVTGYFMVDTGSEMLVLNKAYFRAGPDGRAVAAVGNTGMVNAVVEQKVDSLRLEQLVMQDINAHLVDLHHIELKKNVRMIGILGYNVYKNFEVFIDFQNRVIVLTRVNRQGIRIDTLAPYEVPYDSLDFDLRHHLIVVEAKINSVKLDMILDSGAELNLIDRRVNRKVLEKFTIIKRVNLLGVGKQEVEVLAGVMNEVECGRQYSEKMNTLLTSLDEINTSFNIKVEGVLGYEFLKKRRVLINYQKRKLYFFNEVRS